MHSTLNPRADQGTNTLSPMADAEEISLGAFVTFLHCSKDACFVGLGNRTVQVHPVTKDLQATAQQHLALTGLPICADKVADSEAIIIGTDDSQLLKITGSVQVLSQLPNGWIEQVACSKPAKLIAYSCGKKTFITNKEGNLLHKISQAQGTVTGLRFNSGGSQLAVARYGGVTLWDTESGELLRECQWRGAHMNLSWSPDDRYVVTATPDKELHCWDLELNKDFRMSGYPGKIRSLSWTADGKHLAAAGADSVTVWPFVNGDPSGKPPHEFGYSFQGIVTQVAAHPHLPVVAAGYNNGTVLLGRFSTGEAIIARAPQGIAISALAWTDDGRRLFAGSEGGELCQIKIKDSFFQE